MKRQRIFLQSRIVLSIFCALGAGISLCFAASKIVRGAAQDQQPNPPQPSGEYVVLAWNDLGMHCYNRSFSDLAVLPPYNTLWAQIIKIGEKPQVITTGLTVEYFFLKNTTSVGKTDFWQYDFDLFGVDLQQDVGLAGFGLSGEMEMKSDHFEAVGIPLTEFQDSAPSTPYPYQIATVIVKETASGNELTRTNAVSPVSSEMRCDNCHYDHGPGNDDFATGVVEQNILNQHDSENLEVYPIGHQGPLMGRRPVLCAECHSSNALGAQGLPDIPSLSNAMHEKHDGIVADSLNGCYNCHPGPQTQCLRDVMSRSPFLINCIDCHGTMYVVSQNDSPWLQEPRCDSAACHGNSYAQNHPLYRMSIGHGGIYCAGCHDSPHAIAPSRETNDSLKFIGLQSYSGPLDRCVVCHATEPTGSGPHGLYPVEHLFLFLPSVFRP